MKRAFQFTMLFSLLLWDYVNAQEVKGHIKLLHNLFIPYPDTLIWFTDQSIENRLEFKYNTWEWFRIEAHMRNRFIYGDFVENIPNYSSLIDNSRNFIDLSLIWSDGRSFVGHTEFDRLFAKITYHNIEFTVGRQRINWGIDWVWNPNDVFNTFSYLNLEYPERPGTDALNLKVYTGSLSYIDIVYQPNKTVDSSAYGFRYRTNVSQTDFQVLVARMAGYYVLGGGFSSEAWQFAIRSEISYFHAHKASNKDGWVATLSADHSFGSNNFAQIGALFNSFGSKGSHNPLSIIEPRVQSPMMLSRGKVSLFVGVNSTVVSLFTPSLSILTNPVDWSAAVIPSIGYSASDNLMLSFAAMLFTGQQTNEFPNIGQFIYCKVLWNF